KVPIFSLPKMFSPVVLNSAGQASLVPMLDMIIHLTSSTLVICLQLCAPVLIAIFVADLILGITNRIAPMINVFEMGFNIKGFVGVLLVYLSLPLIISQSRHWFLVMFQAFDKMVEFFR
ncbi:MAG: flagellar biosynthetic protein FliR, partial [Deltaproteobacteria bacterium]|nr:flagellar biosynthetic protein FliR [Deltaproteobacteria bacterium]